MAQTTNDLNGEVFLKRQFTSARGLSTLGFLLFFVSMTLFAAEPLRISA